MDPDPLDPDPQQPVADWHSLLGASTPASSAPIADWHDLIGAPDASGGPVADWHSLIGAPSAPVEAPSLWGSVGHGLAKAADWATSPIQPLTDLAHKAALGYGMIPDNGNPLLAFLKQSGAGISEGGAKLVTPANLAALASGAGELAGAGELGGAGVSALMRLLQGGTSAVSGIEGARDIHDARTWGDVARGAGEVALGVGGAATATRGLGTFLRGAEAAGPSAIAEALGHSPTGSGIPVPDIPPVETAGGVPETPAVDASRGRVPSTGVPQPHTDVSLSAPDPYSSSHIGRYDDQLGGLRDDLFDRRPDTPSTPPGAPEAPSASTPDPSTPEDAVASFLGQPVKPKIPPSITALWQDLKLKWQQSVDAQAGDQIPFTVDPHEDLLPFAKRVMGDDPRALMGDERNVRANLSPADLAAARPGEAGYVDLPSADELHGWVDKANTGIDTVNYFNRLSAPGIVVRKFLNDAGSVNGRAWTELWRGNPGLAGRMMKEYYSPTTVRDALQEFQHPTTPPSGTSDWGSGKSLTGVTGAPSRAMQALDTAGINAVQRAGIVDPAEAAQIFPGRATPQTQTLNALGGLPSRLGAVGRWALPFARTAANRVEQGIGTLPGIGPVAQFLTKGKIQSSLGSQILGAGAGTLGYLDPDLGENRYVQALAGPAALPMAAASAVRRVFDKPQGSWSDAADAAVGSLLSMAPGQVSPYSMHSKNIVSEMLVPNALTTAPVAGTGLPGLPRAPSDFEKDPHSFWDPTIAKIPYLNELLLHQKPTSKQKPWWD